MGDDLKYVIHSIMEKFIKPEILQGAKTPAKLVSVDPMDKGNILPYKEVEIGFATKQASASIRNKSDLAVMRFCNDCVTFLQNLTAKLQDRSPLKHSLLMHLKCMDPRFMIQDPQRAVDKFTNVLKKALALHWYTAADCDIMLSEYKNFLRDMTN